MNRYGLNFLSFRRWMSVLGGLLLIVFGGFYFVDVSAKTDSLPEQTLVLGKLAFVTNIGTQSGGFPVIRTANADGSGVVQLTSFPPNASFPSWSPDGTKIVYIADADIYVMNADGTNQTNLTNTTAFEFIPRWSATGKIAYERDSRIWTMNADGTNQEQFAGITQNARYPAWSADGSKLAYTSGGEIWKINADGTNAQRVTTNSTTETYPSWSPDGTKIVFEKGSGGIAVINADGTNETNLTTTAFDTSPAWSPDGSTIAFRRSASPGGIYTMDATGGNQVRIIANTGTFPQSNSNDSPAWQPLPAPRRTPFDFDGDGKADVSVFRPSDGIWYRLNSSNNSFNAVPFGASSDIIAPADYDGDGKTDIAVFRGGFWYYIRSSDNAFGAFQFGANNDQPAAADYDGDGKAEFAVLRYTGSSSRYYILNSGSGTVSNTYFDAYNRQPLPGDYDGDGKVDVATLRGRYPNTAVWRIINSSNGSTTDIPFGILAIESGETDLTAQGDYDGDGKTDIAVFRPSTGVWYIRQSSNTTIRAEQFGQAGDIPIPADYDGDGKTDVAVYRPSNGAWYMQRSTAGFTALQFGVSTDKPVPSAFLPTFIPSL